MLQVMIDHPITTTTAIVALGLWAYNVITG